MTSPVRPVLSRFSLAGKVAVITGASSGLGVAFALAMAEAGADIAIGARREDRLNDTVALITAVGRDVVSVRTDVTNRGDCDRLTAAAMERFGHVDILVNNAGNGGEYHEVTEDPPEHFLRIVDVNLNGSYWMLQACGRVMKPGSSVINISSVMALTTARMPASAYSAAKSAILGLTRDIAAQWGSKGIRVNAILPGVFITEATANYSENYQRKIIDARIPLGRIGDPSDVAATAVFLASDASSYVTGVSLPVDGGVLLL
jgi:NAD(P)-dependent dehydrogenase (short-subunit alcohol dehydrogenase family)